MSGDVERQWKWNAAVKKAGVGVQSAAVRLWNSDNLSQKYPDFDLTTDSDGEIAEQEVIEEKYAVTGTSTVATTEKTPHNLFVHKYGIVPRQLDLSFVAARQDTFFVADNDFIDESDKSTVLGYTGITVTHRAQYARPDSTVSETGWDITGPSGATADEVVSEGVDFQDGDTSYIESNADAEQVVFGIDAIVDPGYDTGHFMRFVVRQPTGQFNLDWELLNNPASSSTIVASGTLTTSEMGTASYTVIDVYLDVSEVANILDYGDLGIKLTSDLLSAGTLRVTAVELRTNGRIRLTSNQTMNKLYDFMQAEAEDDPRYIPEITDNCVQVIGTIDGATFNCYYDIAIATGVTLSGTNMFLVMPDNLLLLEGTGGIAGIQVTDFTGTTYTHTVTGLYTGSRVIWIKQSDESELENKVESSGVAGYAHDGTTVDVWVQILSLSKKNKLIPVTLGASNETLPAAQEDDPFYFNPA